MEANLKLNEASYFLKNMKELIKDPTKQGDIEKDIDKKFVYNFNAFLTNWRSVFEFLLYDYAEKFLTISREEFLDLESCKKIAHERGNSEAVKFVGWYKEKLEILDTDPLWKKRNYSAHRGYLEIIREYRFLPLAHHGSLTAKVKLEKRGDELNTNSTNDRIMRFTYKDKNEEIKLICEKALERMNNIVKEASEKFGN